MVKSVDTVLTVDSNGRISAEFTGHVLATGIDLLAGQNSVPTVDNAINWHRAPSFTNPILAQVDAYEITPGGVATLNAKSGGFEEALLRSDGLSNYLRFANIGVSSVRVDRIGYGRVNFTWTGGTANRTLVIPHGLAVAPKVVQFTPTSGASQIGHILTLTASNSANFTVSIYKLGMSATPGFAVAMDAPAAGSADSFDWLAIG